MEQECKQCHKILYEYRPQKGNESHYQMHPRLELEYDEDGDRFFRCPHCGAKNVVVDVPGDLPQFRIHHLKPKV